MCSADFNNFLYKQLLEVLLAVVLKNGGGGGQGDIPRTVVRGLNSDSRT